MMQTVLLLLLFAVMRVFQQVANKKSSILIADNKQAFGFGAFYQLVATLIGLIGLVIVGFHGFTTALLLYSALMGVCFAVCLYATVFAMKTASVVHVSLFGAGGIFLPCIASIFLFNENMSVWQWIGLAVFVAGAYLLTSDGGEKKRLSIKSVALLLLILLSEGGMQLMQRVFSVEYPDGNVCLFATLSTAFGAVLLGAIYIVFAVLNKKLASLDQETKTDEKEKNKLKSFALFGSMTALGLFFTNISATVLSRNVQSVILSPVNGGITLAVSCLVGTFIFKEKFTWKKLVGIIVAAVAIVLTNLA